MENIYLLIGEKILCISFSNYADSTFIPMFFKEKLKNEILEYVSGYMIKTPKIKSDYFVEFVERREFFQNDSSIDNEGNFRTPFYKIASANRIVTYYHISLYEFQFILKVIITRKLAGKNWFIFHSSVVCNNNYAYAFTGPSGAGKSTAAKLLSSSKQFHSLADDTSIIKKDKKQFFILQTPFIEKDSGIKKGKDEYILKKVFFLKKSNQYKMRKINSKSFVLEQMISGIIAYSKKDLDNQTKLVFNFVESFDQFYYLYFGLDSKKLSHLMDSLSE